MTASDLGVAWAWERVSGPIGGLVGAEIPDPARRLVRVVEFDGTAFVLGSTQPHPGPTDRAPIVRRRSGGGGVLVGPGRLLWVDIVVPRNDPWWEVDVGRAMHPIGRSWVSAFRAVGLDAELHRGPLVASRWSRSLCFAGLGPGVALVKVNVDENQELAQAFRVQGIPAVKIVKDGQLAQEFTGALPKEQIEAILRPLVPAVAIEEDDLGEQAARDPR